MSCKGQLNRFKAQAGIDRVDGLRHHDAREREKITAAYLG